MRWTLLALVLSGCAYKYNIVTGPDQEHVEHYLMVRTAGNGTVKIYDCLSRPDGSTWDPTCQRVEMKGNKAGNEAAKRASEID